MKKFQEMCQEEFEKIELMARGGQKIVFDGVHNSYGETVIKLYFQLNDPRSLREIQIERDLNLSMVPKIYETGTIEYEGTETLYIIEQKVKGTELRKVLESGKRFSLEEAVTFLEQGLQKTETITPVQYSIKGDTQSQFMALLGAMMGKYPSRRPRTAKQAIDWLKVAKKTFVYE